MATDVLHPGGGVLTLGHGGSEPEVILMRKQGHAVQFYVPLGVFGQEQVAVLRSLPAGVQDLDNPAGGHPAAKQVCHTAHEDGLALGLLGRLIEAVSVECRSEAEGVRGVHHLPVISLQQKGTLQLRRVFEKVVGGFLSAGRPSAVSLCNPLGIAVWAPVSASRDRVPGAVAPLDLGLVHLPLTPSRSRQLFTQDGMG